MKRKSFDYDVDLEVKIRVEELDHIIQELERKRNELEDLKMAFNEVWRQYHHHHRQTDEVEKRLKELVIECNKATEHILPAIGFRVLSGVVGESSRKNYDVVKKRKGKGKDVVISGVVDVSEDKSDTANLAEANRCREVILAKKVKRLMEIEGELKRILETSNEDEGDALEHFLDEDLNEVQTELKKSDPYYLALEEKLNETQIETTNEMDPDLLTIIKTMTNVENSIKQESETNGKGHDCTIDPDFNERIAELQHYILELSRRKKVLEDVKMRFHDVSRQHHQRPDDSHENESFVLKKRTLEELMNEFNNNTKEHIGLVKMDQGNKGKDLLISQGNSADIQKVNKKQGDVEMARGKGKSELIFGDDSEESAEFKKELDDVKDESLDHGVSTDTHHIDLATDVEGSEEGILMVEREKLEDVKMRFHKVSRKHHHRPDDSVENESFVLKKRKLEELMDEFNNTKEHIAVSNGVGVSSQEAGDNVKMDQGNKGKDLMISQGNSEDIQKVNKKQGDVEMAKGKGKGELILGDDSEESAEFNKKQRDDDVKDESLDHGVSTDTRIDLATDVEGSKEGISMDEREKLKLGVK